MPLRRVLFVALVLLLAIPAVAAMAEPDSPPTRAEFAALEERVAAVEAKVGITTTTTTAPTTTTEAPTTTAAPTTTTTAVPSSADIMSTSQLLARTNVDKRASAEFSDSGETNVTYDLSDAAQWSGTDRFPTNITSVTRAAVVGGKWAGTFPRTLSWYAMKERERDGTSIRFQSNDWGILDRLEVENVMDGVRLLDNGSEFVLRDSRFTYIRDDFVENDQLLAGYIRDTLVDGTFMGISCRPGAKTNPPAADAPIVVDGLLMRLERMPYTTDRGGDKPSSGSLVDGEAHAQPFKLGKCPRFEMSNSVIVVPGLSVNGSGSMAFPAGSYSNVTVITESGTYPTSLPAGVRVTKDMSIWHDARADWLARH